jgi:hypothetical protein
MAVSTISGAEEYLPPCVESGVFGRLGLRQNVVEQVGFFVAVPGKRPLDLTEHVEFHLARSRHLNYITSVMLCCRTATVKMFAGRGTGTKRLTQKVVGRRSAEPRALIPIEHNDRYVIVDGPVGSAWS